jgi:hypothetical protein
MYARTIDSARHGAAQGIDFLRQLTFAYAADGRVATHLAEGFEILRQQQGLSAKPSRGQGRFGAGVTAADNDAVETSGVIHGHSRRF